MNQELMDSIKQIIDQEQHNPKSIALFKALSDIDLFYRGDYFGWKSGGEGDNGEELMTQLDIYFGLQEKEVL